MQRTRPVGLVVAAACGVGLGLTFVGFAIASAIAGHGLFSLQIGLLLAAFGLAMVAAGAGLWLRRRWARGPAVALSLMSGFGFGEYALQQPWLWLLALLSLGSVVGGVLPSTSRALVRRPGQPPRPA